MGGSSTTLSIILKLVDDASEAMQGVGAKINSVGDSLTGLGNSVRSTGTSLLGISAPLLAAGYAIENTYADVHQSIARAGAFVGATTDQIEGFEQAVINAQRGSGFAMKDVADALGAFVGGEVTAQMATEQLGDVINLALVTRMSNLQEVANLAATAMSVYSNEAIQATNVSDAMAVVAANVTQQTDRFAEAFTETAGSARAAGFSFKDNIVILSQLVNAGNDVNLVAAALNGAFNNVQQGSRQMSEALQSVGMSTKEMQDALRSGPTEWLAKIKEGFDRAQESGQGYVFLTHVLGREAADQFAVAMAKSSDSMANVAGWFDNMNGASKPLIETMRATVPPAQLLRSTFEQLAMQGKPLDDFLHSLADAFQTLVDWFLQLSPRTQEWIFGIGLLIAVAAPLLIVLGSVVSAIGTIATVISAAIPIVLAVGTAVAAISGPVLIIIALVALLAFVIYTHWSQIIDWTSDMMLKVADIWNKGWQGISNFFTTIWGTITTGIQNAIGVITGLLDHLFSTVSNITSKIMAPIQAVTGAVSNVASGVGNAVGGAFNNVVKAFASGGIVTGPTLAMVGEAGPEAIIPLSAFSGGPSLVGPGGFGGGGNIVININGGNYLDSGGATMIANAIGRQIVQQLRLKNFN